MKIRVAEIKNAEPKREHGDIEGLKASILDVGLIQPIVIDENHNILAGRRRYQAVSELGWNEVECHVLPVNGDRLKAFRISLDENLKRKPLTDPEVFSSIKEYDELKRELEGERKAGGDRQSNNYTVTNDSGWTQGQTARDLGISRPAVSKAIKLATAVEEYPELASVKGGERILTEYEKKKNFAHVGFACGENEWYTPEAYAEAARQVMGGIDVDPASTEIANQIIKATIFYSAQDDGRKQKWLGNVWMNPPYSQPLITEFTALLVEKLLSGEVNQACVLVNNATETNWYQGMMVHSRAICFIKGRVKFLNKNGESNGAPLQGQTILYFGENAKKFRDIFSQFGAVLHAD